MTDNNLYYYNQARNVPTEAQKAFNNGNFSGTDINPMWRIKKLTELFGPCGIGWYYDVVSERAEMHGDMTMAIVDLNLYVRVDGEWSKPIYGTGGNTLVKQTKNGPKPSDEGYKMALTDALSVACKALGVGADIYFDKDKTKYTQDTPDDAIPQHTGMANKPPKSDIKIQSIEPPPMPFDLKKAINAWCKRMNCKADDFYTWRKLAIDKGKAPDKLGKDMKPEDFDQLAKAIEELAGVTA